MTDTRTHVGNKESATGSTATVSVGKENSMVDFEISNCSGEAT